MTCFWCSFALLSTRYYILLKVTHVQSLNVRCNWLEFVRWPTPNFPLEELVTGSKKPRMWHAEGLTPDDVTYKKFLTLVTLVTFDPENLLKELSHLIHRTYKKKDGHRIWPTEGITLWEVTYNKLSHLIQRTYYKSYQECDAQKASHLGRWPTPNFPPFRSATRCHQRFPTLIAQERCVGQHWQL